MEQGNDVLKDVFNDFINQPPTPQPQVDVGKTDDGLDNLAGEKVNQQETSTSLETKVNDKVDVSGTDSVDETKSQDDVSDDASWDSLVEDSSSDLEGTKSSNDWIEVGKALGITSEIKDQNDVVNYVKDLQTTVENLKTSAQVSKDLPKELSEALEVHKNGGDYLSYLMVAAEDYSTYDPVELFEDEVAELFYEQDGSFRQEEFDEYIDSMNEAEKILRGRQIQRELMLMQENKKRELQNKATLEKQKSLQELEKSLEGFQKVGKYDVTPKVKKQLFNELATGKFLENLGVSMNGSHNWEKVLSNYFKARYFDTIQAHIEKNKGKDTTRQIIDSVTNSNVNRQGNITNPTSAPAPKVGADLYLESIIKKQS